MNVSDFLFDFMEENDKIFVRLPTCLLKLQRKQEPRHSQSSERSMEWTRVTVHHSWKMVMASAIKFSNSKLRTDMSMIILLVAVSCAT